MSERVMNRVQRRAAASRTRRTRAGYLHRLAAAQGQGTFAHLRGKLAHVMIQHDHWCSVYHGSSCSCIPNISIHGPGDVIEVDAEGCTKKSVVS